MDPNWKSHAWLRRLVFTVVIISQVILGTRYLIDVLPYHGRNLLELSLAMIFALLFTWISIGFWMGVYGFVLRLIGGDRLSLLRRHQADLDAAELARTARLLLRTPESIATPCSVKA